jgi:predicted RNase H-like nuclease (RuvC/YqgF family)
VSVSADRARRPELPSQWERLERAVEDAALASTVWKRRALEAEAEVLHLRRALEDLASEGSRPGDMDEELRRLRAENAALQSRMLEARKRAGSLMRRLLALGVET